MGRLSQSQLLEFDRRRSTRQRQLIAAVATFRLMSSSQLLSYLEQQRPEAVGTLSSLPRLLRNDLAYLSRERVLHRLERRIGGVRAGSAGHVYALGPIGLRLTDLWRGDGVRSPRSSYEPQLGFQSHALAVVDVMLDCLAAANRHRARPAFKIEPHCWRDFVGPHGERTTLKPDAELEVQFDGFADHWWLELDQATERRSTLQRKLASYVAYYRSGDEQRSHGVFPVTAWIVPNAARAAVLREEIARLPNEYRGLFQVVERSQAAAQLVATGGAQ